MVSVTTVCRGPRMSGTTSSIFMPLTDVPSTARMTSPAASPAVTAGAPRMTLVMTSWQVSRWCRRSRPGALDRQLDADTHELTRQPTQAGLVLLLGHVEGERVTERLEDAVDGTFDERMLVDRAHVVRGHVVIGVPERPEQFFLACRGAGRRTGQPSEREAGHEEAGTAEECDQEQSDDGERPYAARAGCPAPSGPTLRVSSPVAGVG